MTFSIIICSRTEDISPQLRQNIADTIGEAWRNDYELVVIDNSSNRHSIFQAYNLGVERAQGKNLLFMHDDITYLSTDWGSRILDCMSSDQVGACAIAGFTYLKRAPSFYTIGHNCHRINIRHDNGNNMHDYDTRDEIVVFDGVWFCIKSQCFSQIRFDESFGGFHFYDFDISTQLITAGWKIVTAPGIDILHHSVGYWQTTDWIEKAFRFYDKWKLQLPLRSHDCPPLTDRDAAEIETIYLYPPLKIILRNRAWRYLPRWATAAAEVLGTSRVRAASKVLWHHFTNRSDRT